MQRLVRAIRWIRVRKTRRGSRVADRPLWDGSIQGQRHYLVVNLKWFLITIISLAWHINDPNHWPSAHWRYLKECNNTKSCAFDRLFLFLSGSKVILTGRTPLPRVVHVYKHGWKQSILSLLPLPIVAVSHLNTMTFDFVGSLEKDTVSHSENSINFEWFFSTMNADSRSRN